MKRRLLFAGTLLFVCANLMAQSASPAWKRAEHLRHGINASEWMAQSHDYSPQRLRTFTTLDDIARMHSMGFDHVRLSIDPAVFDCQGPWDQCERIQILDEVIAKALSVDLAVILDVHPSDEYKRQLASSDSSVDKFTALWNQIATHYAKSDRERVFFEILNEPEVGVYRWAGIQQSLVGAIRRDAPTHTIIVTCGEYSNADDLARMPQVADDNIIVNFLLQSAHLHAPGCVMGRGLLGRPAPGAVPGHFGAGGCGHCETDRRVCALEADAIRTGALGCAARCGRDPICGRVGQTAKRSAHLQRVRGVPQLLQSSGPVTLAGGGPHCA